MALNYKLTNKPSTIDGTGSQGSVLQTAYYKKGEELTCNYGPTHHDGKLSCRCGMAGCIGFL